MSRAKCELWLCTWWLLCFPALTCYFVRCLKCKNILAEVCLLVSVCLLTKHNSDLFYFLFPASTERVTSLAVNLWGLWLRGVYNCLCFSCLHFSKSWCFSSLTKTWLIKGKITESSHCFFSHCDAVENSRCCKTQIKTVCDFFGIIICLWDFIFLSLAM